MEKINKFVLNLKFEIMKNVIKLLVFSLYLVCSIYACWSLAADQYQQGGLFVIPAALFSLCAIGSIYFVVSKTSEEYKKLPIGTDFLLLCVQIIAMIWQSIKLYIIGDSVFGILLTLCALFGGYQCYLYITHNKKK